MLNKFDNNTFPKETSVNTTTTFCPSGSVYINPCSFEEQEVHYEDKPIKQRGTLIVQENGASVFVPFNKSLAPRFLRIYSTPVSEVRIYRKVAQLVIRFPYDVPTKVATQIVSEAAKETVSHLRKTYPKQFSLNN